ncbi:uncharacterized protein LOC124889421 [Capsicum annuum]|uniref:uncharacterized protein LOC124889421 n=1 Tax=Capsicum annuum TaxID=4072 RepID=UPI001FB1277E|nr:uncharacterized protein LOC124889421 [Capsicum annuum]
MINTLDDHCYTPEPIFKLMGPPKFYAKKPGMPEEQEKMVGKMKSAENAMKSFLGPAGKENVSYKDWGMFSSVNLSPKFKISEFEEHAGYENSVKHLGRYCHQLRETEGKKKKTYLFSFQEKSRAREFQLNNIFSFNPELTHQIHMLTCNKGASVPQHRP